MNHVVHGPLWVFALVFLVLLAVVWRVAYARGYGRATLDAIARLGKRS
jgi:hypothetical protein